MNNEIKEIRDYIACPQFGDDYYGEWGALRLDQRRKIKSLLDYITNLEQENEELNRMCEIYSKSLYNAELTDYKSRIDKAIEIVKEASCYNEETKTFCDDIWEELPELLHILTGGDEE